MGNAAKIESAVEVNVAPELAFQVFTEELHCWWQQGAINFHDSSKAYHMAIEPGVGGRVMEVYNTDSGEGLELARVTAWEPGKRMAWQSSIDDVAVEILFSEVTGGTRVSVTAALAEGGRDAGGTAWVRMTPNWLSAWVAQRTAHTTEPFVPDRLAIVVQYGDAAAAAKWLRDVFEFEPNADLPEVTQPESTWIEFRVGQGTIVLWQSSEKRQASGVHTPWVFVDDVEALFTRVQDRAAEILAPITVHGAKSFTVADLEGNPWTFAQASPRMLV